MLLGLDVGKVRVGVASTVDLNTPPVPIGAFQRAQNNAEGKILALIEELQISKIVVGYPLSESGAKTSQCNDIDQFCNRLSRRTTVTINRIDEGDSSKEAQERIASRKKIAKLDLRSKGAVDAVAACVILERYLKSQSNSLGSL